MGYTTSELLAELLIAIGNREDSTFDSDWRLRKLNLAYRELWSGILHPELERRVYATVAANQRVIPLPSDCFAVISVRDHTNGNRLTPISYRDLDNRQWTTGVPARYARFGLNIEIDPYSDESWELKLRYQRRPPDLSATQNSLLAAEWDEAILLGAKFRAFDDLGQLDRSVKAKNDYLALVRSRLTQVEKEAEESDFGLEVEVE